MTSEMPLNVLFICSDQWRGDCLSALSHPTVKTPHIDELAQGGVLFRNHFTQCTPCGPSRTSLLTGLYLMNHRSGRNGTPLDARHSNVALEMRKGGYDPVLFGYTDTSLDPRGRHPNDPALRAYDEGVMPGFRPVLHMPEHMGPWVADLKAKGYPIKGREDVFAPRAGFKKPDDRGHRYIPAAYEAKDSDTAFMTDNVIEWLTVQDKAKPWFAHLVYMRPHPPFIAPEPYNRLYDPAAVPAPKRAATPQETAGQHPFLDYCIGALARKSGYDEHNPHILLSLSDLELRQMRAAFYGLMSEVDFHLGRLVDHLKASGQYDNTLIIFTSDHGEMLGDQYMWGKEVFFDPAMHVPLVVRDPRRQADATRGRIVAELTQAVDVMPTILESARLDVPRAADGQSLMPFLYQKTVDDWREAAFWEHDFRDVVNLRPETALGLVSDECNYAVLRGKTHKYIHFAGLPPLLFNIAEDPHEMENLAGKPGAEKIMLSMAQAMLSKRQVHADRTLTNMFLTSEGLFSRK